MNKKVVALFGINASGKTSIGKMIASLVPGAVFVQSSGLLMERLGSSREALECMSAESKEQVLRAALHEAFRKNAGAPLIVADMHLVVTIRKDSMVTRERLWSPEYLEYLRGAFFLHCPAPLILSRRENDMTRTGRRRNMGLQAIIDDIAINLEEFRNLIQPSIAAAVIENTKPTRDVAHSILSSLDRVVPWMPPFAPFAASYRAAVCTMLRPDNE